MHILPEEMLHEMMNNCPMGFMVLTESHHIVDINKHGAELFGYTPEEMIGQNFNNYVTSPFHEAHVKTYVSEESDRLVHEGASGIDKSGRVVRLSVTVDKLSNGMAYAVFYKPTDFLKGDRLTGALTREQLEAHVEKFMDDFKYSVLFIDLNDFKIINDDLGHDTGDMVLKTVGKRITNVLRECDLFARWGGDEFIIVVPGGLDVALTVSAKVSVAIGEVISTKRGKVNIGCSTGIAANSEADNFTDLIAIADKRMYNAKGVKVR